MYTDNVRMNFDLPRRRHGTRPYGAHCGPKRSGNECPPHRRWLVRRRYPDRRGKNEASHIETRAVVAQPCRPPGEGTWASDRMIGQADCSHSVVHRRWPQRFCWPEVSNCGCEGLSSQRDIRTYDERYRTKRLRRSFSCAPEPVEVRGPSKPRVVGTCAKVDGEYGALPRSPGGFTEDLEGQWRTRPEGGCNGIEHIAEVLLALEVPLEQDRALGCQDFRIKHAPVPFNISTRIQKRTRTSVPLDVHERLDPPLHPDRRRPQHSA